MPRRRSGRCRAETDFPSQHVGEEFFVGFIIRYNERCVERPAHAAFRSGSDFVIRWGVALHQHQGFAIRTAHDGFCNIKGLQGVMHRICVRLPASGTELIKHRINIADVDIQIEVATMIPGHTG